MVAMDAVGLLGTRPPVFPPNSPRAARVYDNQKIEKATTYAHFLLVDNVSKTEDVWRLYSISTIFKKFNLKVIWSLF